MIRDIQEHLINAILSDYGIIKKLDADLFDKDLQFFVSKINKAIDDETPINYFVMQLENNLSKIDDLVSRIKWQDKYIDIMARLPLIETHFDFYLLKLKEFRDMEIIKGVVR